MKTAVPEDDATGGPKVTTALAFFALGAHLFKQSLHRNAFRAYFLLSNRVSQFI